MRLLPTIRSRCQLIPVPLPDRGPATAALQKMGIPDAEKWLSLAGGAPVLAAELQKAGQGAWLDQLVKRLAAGGRNDALAAAVEIEKLLKDSKGKVGLRHVVDWTQKWVTDMVLVGHCLPVRYFSGQRATIEQLVAAAPVYKLLNFYRKLSQERGQAEQPLNVRLFLENFFLDYRVLFSK